jgi:hypothetical protein
MQDRVAIKECQIHEDNGLYVDTPRKVDVNDKCIPYHACEGWGFPDVCYDRRDGSIAIYAAPAKVHSILHVINLQKRVKMR